MYSFSNKSFVVFSFLNRILSIFALLLSVLYFLYREQLFLLVNLRNNILDNSRIFAQQNNHCMFLECSNSSLSSRSVEPNKEDGQQVFWRKNGMSSFGLIRFTILCFFLILSFQSRIFFCANYQRWSSFSHSRKVLF